MTPALKSLVDGFVQTIEKEAKMGQHQCAVGRQWTLALDNYPQVCLLCRICGKEMQRIPLDDLGKSDLDYFLRIIKMHRRKKGEGR